MEVLKHLAGDAGQGCTFVVPKSQPCVTAVLGCGGVLG